MSEKYSRGRLVAFIRSIDEEFSRQTPGDGATARERNAIDQFHERARDLQRAIDMQGYEINDRWIDQQLPIPKKLCQDRLQQRVVRGTEFHDRRQPQTGENIRCLEASEIGAALRRQEQASPALPREIQEMK